MLCTYFSTPRQAIGNQSSAIPQTTPESVMQPDTFASLNVLVFAHSVASRGRFVATDAFSEVTESFPTRSRWKDDGRSGNSGEADGIPQRLAHRCEDWPPRETGNQCDTPPAASSEARCLTHREERACDCYAACGRLWRANPGLSHMCNTPPETADLRLLRQVPGDPQPSATSRGPGEAGPRGARVAGGGAADLGGRVREVLLPRG